MPYVMTFSKGPDRLALTAASPAEVLTLIKIKKDDGYEIVGIVDPSGNETKAHYLAYSIAGFDTRFV